MTNTTDTPNCVIIPCADLKEGMRIKVLLSNPEWETFESHRNVRTYYRRPVAYDLFCYDQSGIPTRRWGGIHPDKGVYVLLEDS